MSVTRYTMSGIGIIILFNVRLRCMLNKILEGFLNAAKATSLKKVPRPVVGRCKHPQGVDE